MLIAEQLEKLKPGDKVKQVWCKATGAHDVAKVVYIHSNGALDVECVKTGKMWGWSSSRCEIVEKP